MDLINLKAPLTTDLLITELMIRTNYVTVSRSSHRQMILIATRTCRCGTTAPPRRASTTWPSRRPGKPESPLSFITSLTTKSKWLKSLLRRRTTFSKTWCIFFYVVDSNLTIIVVDQIKRKLYRVYFSEDW